MLFLRSLILKGRRKMCIASLAVLGKLLYVFLNYANYFLNPFCLYSKEVIQKALKEMPVHLSDKFCFHLRPGMANSVKIYIFFPHWY